MMAATLSAHRSQRSGMVEQERTDEAGASSYRNKAKELVEDPEGENNVDARMEIATGLAVVEMTKYGRNCPGIEASEEIEKLCRRRGAQRPPQQVR